MSTKRKTKSVVKKPVKRRAKIRVTSSNSKAISRELGAVIFFVSAVFLFMCNRYPETTGLIGHLFISTGTLLFGSQGLQFLPLFLLLPSISFIVTRIRKRVVVAAVFLSFLSQLILIESAHSSLVVWPPQFSVHTGWVGSLGTTFLLKLIGYNGTFLVLSGVFVGTIILIFGLSLKRVFLATFMTLQNMYSTSQKATKTLKKKKKKPMNTSLLHALFYRKRKYVVSVKRKQAPKTIDAVTESFNFDDVPIEEPAQVDPSTIPVQTPTVEKKKKTSKPTVQVATDFQLPPLSLLSPGGRVSLSNTKSSAKHRQEQAAMLEEALANFKVAAKVVNITIGPSVTRYELQPGTGVKISKITSLANDIALQLAAPDIRIEAPIPGKSLVGIEVPNPEVDTITLRSIIDQTDFSDRVSKLVTVVGLTITGDSILMDLGKMPHILIAGATGSGKSVCINSIILSILMRATPDEVKFLMIDPKKVELSFYEGIPHLLAPVVTNPNKAAATLKKWALIEMEHRYEMFSQAGVKDIKGYNEHIESTLEKQRQQEKEAKETSQEGEEVLQEELKKLPYIVVIIDELADLMMVASQDVENTICRLAQMARATGIHLVVATQRPSVNVVTGLIKANIPSRISFFLQSQIDSRTILDMGGAEKLLGKGDMLYSPVGSFKPKRVQGVFVSENEVKTVVDWLKKQGTPDYVEEILEVEPLNEESDTASSAKSSGQDDLYEEAKNLVMSTQYASTSYLQRKLRIGYNRAARIMDELEENGVISEYVGDKKARSIAP